MAKASYKAFEAYIMGKFERIVREPLVMGGQARIRDTGITVNEIKRPWLTARARKTRRLKPAKMRFEENY